MNSSLCCKYTPFIPFRQVKNTFVVVVFSYLCSSVHMVMNIRNKQILNIALPSIASNITVPLLGMVDVAITGHLGSAVYMGAIAVGAMIFNLVYWIFGFLRMGTSGTVSQAFGRRDLAEASRLLVRSIVVALLLALVLVVLQRPLLSVMLLLIHPTPDVAPSVATYFGICIWGAPAMLSLYGLSGWFIGMQNTRIPMVAAIVQNVANIVASLVLVCLFGMKMEGVALGTVAAQYAGLFVALFCLVRRYGRLRRYFSSDGLFAWSAISSFFGVNRDIFLRTLFLVAVNLYFTSAGARQGATVLAVNAMLMQLFLLFSYVMDGFAYAGEAVGGRYFGARNRRAFADTVRRLFLWGLLVTVLFTAVYAIGGNAFLSLLTDDAHVIAVSGEYFPWALAIPVAGCAAFVWDGLFIGMTATRLMLLSSALSAAAFFAVAIGLFPLMGNHALWLALLVFLAMRSLVQTVAGLAMMYKDT